MVYYSDVARNDLRNILWGLANWEKHPLLYEHAALHVSDIRKEADTVCKKSYHCTCTLAQHLLYGEKIHVYKRNAQTHWYVIYNWDETNRIAYVTKILNNYLTC